MHAPHADWIAPAGLRAVGPDTDDAAIPADVLGSPSLSLIAKGVYALTVTHQGQPVDPYDDAVEDAPDIAAAIQELIKAGLIVRVKR